MAVMLKKGGAKLSRSETVTVRLDPALRYLAELASRKQRRTLSSFIEYAIEQSLKNININHEGSCDETTFFSASRFLWDVNEVDRLLLLAQHYPSLLNHQEQILWKLIKEFSAYNSFLESTVRLYDHKSNEPNVGLIKACWKELNAVVDGSGNEKELKDAMVANELPF